MSSVLINRTDLLKHRRATHILCVFYTLLIKFMSTFYCLTVLSLKKKYQVSINLHQGMPHTYCQHSIRQIFSQLTRYCAHVLNHMLIPDGTGQDQNWFHMALFLLSFCRHSSETKLTDDDFQRRHVLTKCLLTLTGNYSIKSEVNTPF
jgi:hypothetical protein